MLLLPVNKVKRFTGKEKKSKKTQFFYSTSCITTSFTFIVVQERLNNTSDKPWLTCSLVACQRRRGCSSWRTDGAVSGATVAEWVRRSAEDACGVAVIRCQRDAANFSATRPFPSVEVLLFSRIVFYFEIPHDSACIFEASFPVSIFVSPALDCSHLCSPAFLH